MNNQTQIEFARSTIAQVIAGRASLAKVGSIGNGAMGKNQKLILIELGLGALSPSPSALASELALHRSAVSHDTKGLIERGLIHEQSAKASPGFDARYRVLELTEKGCKEALRLISQLHAAGVDDDY